MNQTEHYGLSQWALADRVEMKDFNADNAKLDAALAALAGTQTGESARLDAAMAAETKRVNTELAKKALAADLATAKTGLETSLGGKLEQVTLLSNKSFSLSGASTSITVPGKEMAKCSLVMAVINTTGLTYRSLLYANSSYCSHCEIGSLYSANGLVDFKAENYVLVFFPMKGCCPFISGMAFCTSCALSFFCSVAYSDLTNFTFMPPSKDSTLAGTGTIKIYGLR